MCVSTNAAISSRLTVITVGAYGSRARGPQCESNAGVYSGAMPARCGVTLLFACWILAEEPSAAFGIGILRRDGIVIPFADFDGKRWRANWPAAAEQVDVPVNVLS